MNRVSILGIEEGLGVEPIGEVRSVLPEDLIDQIVVVHVQCGYGDPWFRLDTEQGTGRDQRNVTDIEIVVTELSEQNCGPRANNCQLGAVERTGPERAMNGS